MDPVHTLICSLVQAFEGLDPESQQQALPNFIAGLNGLCGNQERVARGAAARQPARAPGAPAK